MLHCFIPDFWWCVRINQAGARDVSHRAYRLLRRAIARRKAISKEAIRDPRADRVRAELARAPQVRRAARL